jgi:hypothetical protein
LCVLFYCNHHRDKKDDKKDDKKNLLKDYKIKNIKLIFLSFIGGSLR